MATITYNCHHCDATVTTRLEGTVLTCGQCQTQLPVDPSTFHPTITCCVACPSHDLFVRKDFSPRFGLTIVLTGFLFSTIAWANYWIMTSFAILFATALIDLVLFFTMGNVVECYCCHAQYRGLSEEGLARFNLDVHERHRQAAARWKQHAVSEKPSAAPAQ